MNIIRILESTKNPDDELLKRTSILNSTKYSNF